MQGNNPLDFVFDLFTVEGAIVALAVTGRDGRILDAVCEEARRIETPKTPHGNYPEDVQTIDFGIHPHELRVGAAGFITNHIVIVRTE